MSKYFSTSRRLLILVVLLSAVFVFSNNNKADASVCCHSCDAAYQSCLEWCATYVKEDNYESCVSLSCEADFTACGSFCEQEPGIFGCEH
jgi:hypothetical protein